MKVKFVPINGGALQIKPYLPAKAHDDDAGFDLRWQPLGDDERSRGIVLRRGHRTLLPTGIAVEMPEGYCALVLPRSGLSLKGMAASVGLIDAGYRGEIGVVMESFHHDPIHLHPGERIAQLVFVQLADVETEVVEEKDLSESERGDNGFGSTGTE